MITVWSKTKPGKVYTALSPVLSGLPEDYPLSVVGDMSVPLGTKVIFAGGKDALDYLSMAGLLPKKRKITTLRGVPVKYKLIPVIPSFDPAVGDIDHGYYIDMLTDFALAVRLHDTGNIKPKIGKYRWVVNFNQFIDKVIKLHEATGLPVDVTYDLETLGTDPYCLPSPHHPGAYIVSAQFCCEKGTGDAVYFDSRQSEELALSFCSCKGFGFSHRSEERRVGKECR